MEAYLPDKRRGPSALKQVLHRQIVPAAVNLAGGMEAGLERASIRSGLRPSIILAAVLGGLLLSVIALRRADR